MPLQAKSFGKRILGRVFGSAMLTVIGIVPVWAGTTCPRLIMFDGVDIRTQDTVEQAKYWGQTIGVDGFFVNSVMTMWQQDVGTDPSSGLWQQARKFQGIYSQYGVTDNFVKIALWKPHDWRKTDQNAAAVQHFAHVAALAKYAGFKGIALDFEPYVPAWGGAAGGPELAAVVEHEGRAIGEAMHSAYPDMTLWILQDALLNAYPDATLAKMKSGQLHIGDVPAKNAYHGGYSLAIPFLRGLLSVQWNHFVVGTEATYNSPEIATTVAAALSRYRNFAASKASSDSMTVAPGLWPLGHTYTDKTGLESPESFEHRLQVSFASASQYVWIYGEGSAWQTNGPYGDKKNGPVAPNFSQYLDAIRRARSSCSTGSHP